MARRGVLGGGGRETVRRMRPGDRVGEGRQRGKRYDRSMRIPSIATLVSVLLISQAAIADDPVAPATPKVAEPAAVELTEALLHDLSVVLEKRTAAENPKRVDPAWFEGLALTAERFDAVYDEVARAQHATPALFLLAERRRGLERALEAMVSNGTKIEDRRDTERELADVRAEETALAPASDVERRNRETMWGRATFPRLELRVPLTKSKPATPVRPGWPFVDPN
jgi:hypothetical protein